MRRFLLTVLIISTAFTTHGQQLTADRVQKIKNCTVRIAIDSAPATGLGFFISPMGYLLTCWHLVEPAILLDPARHISGIKKIYVIYQDGSRQEYTIPAAVLRNVNQQAVAYDFCLLVPAVAQKPAYPYFKVGNFDVAAEGQEVYTCSYMGSAALPFLSKGTISSKYTYKSIISTTAGEKEMLRRQALLTLSMAADNAGAPIVQFGATPADDEVIGIADYMIDPATNNITPLPDGVSNCISLNHFLAASK